VVHEQAAAFALDALDSDEARDFERHLLICPDCEEELERFRIAAAALAFAGELPLPRANLRRRVLAVDAVVLHIRRRVTAPVLGAAALAACAALAIGLTGGGHQGQTRRLSLQLPAAPAGKVYEIWFIRSGRALPAGFGHGGRIRIAHIPRGTAVAVTLEPRGGSRRPTGPLLLRTETA
jgi:hypothetical protein